MDLTPSAGPRNIVLEQLQDDSFPEMSAFDSAFLCGLIRSRRPSKVAEVSVAGGGTTAVLLQCLSMLDLLSKVYSVDICEQFCRDPEKRPVTSQPNEKNATYPPRRDIANQSANFP